MSVGDLVNREERPAYVRFERRAVEDKAASLREGRYVGKDVDFALVTPPYSKDCVEYKVEQWLINVDNNVKNGRIPERFAEIWKESYQKWRNGQEIPLNGTPIKTWGVISPAQQNLLISIGCLTVEDLASINDEGVRRIGMGAIELQNKAKAWLLSLNSHGANTVQIAALETERNILKDMVASLEEKVEALMKAAPKNPVYVQDEPNEIKASDLLEEPSLESQYFAKFGKPPHHRMKPETIQEALRE